MHPKSLNMAKDFLVDVEGITICVDEGTYNYYWNAKRHGVFSDEFKTACRRIMRLGPDDHEFNPNVLFDVFYSVKDARKVLENSSLIEYEEQWYKSRLENEDNKTNYFDAMRKVSPPTKRTRPKL